MRNIEGSVGPRLANNNMASLQVPIGKESKVMWRLISMVVLALVLAGCKSPSSQTLSSSTDTDGTLHPAELQVTHSAKVICVSAQGANNSPAKCNVNNNQLAPAESVTTDEKVYMICAGTAPVHCTAEVQ